MKICYNTQAMIANNALTRNDDRLSQSLQKLSSGLKIVDAKDNPAGMAMGKKMNAQIKGIGVASQNSSDAISVIETADGALAEVHDILQRMNELAVKASTGTMGDVDRATVEEEIKQLKQEITRIAEDTQFNGQTLLNGNFDLKGYTNNADAKVGYYSDGVTPGAYTIDDLTVTFNPDGSIDPASVIYNLNETGSPAFPTDAAVTEVNGNTIKITSAGDPSFEINVKINPDRDVLTGDVITTPKVLTGVELDITGIGAMTMQIGSNEGQTLDIRISTISLDEMGLKNLSVADQASAVDAIDSISGAIQYISTARSRLGAYQNRLEHSISSLDITSENMTAAYSRIMDVDMAEEMTEYTTIQVISQASMSMLAQANERPAQVLQLLQ
ncbi:flagellin [Kineothrix sedimenti]|uniref:Flagellin n=1 Tax=Kineothrix sedimenti TaxID=3123317 RepID=A0ABZ3EXI6_9FIRM